MVKGGGEKTKEVKEEELAELERENPSKLLHALPVTFDISFGITPFLYLVWFYYCILVLLYCLGHS